MNHQEALDSRTTEKYLLGELPGHERDAFEDHFFECEECAGAVRSGVLFMDNAAAELQASAPARAPVAELKPSWKDWFRISWLQPAFVLPVLALLAVSGLWMADRARLMAQLADATAPQSFSDLQLDRTRGAVVPSVKNEGRYFAISFYITDESLPEYAIEISGAGITPATVTVLSRHDGQYNILLPSRRFPPGMYEIAVKAAPAAGGRVLQRFPLSLK